VAATAPLAVGDPVEAPDAGVRGTIASIQGETAEVLGASGLRLKIPIARLRPSASRSEPEAVPEPAVRVFAAARGDVSDQLDVRGMRAQEAREAVRAFVDDAALAGLKTVRVVHGRGTGALRTAVREELGRHSLVESHELESSDGASVAQLG
jgi:DNA mismatch repair protein MutS2